MAPGAQVCVFVRVRVSVLLLAVTRRETRSSASEKEAHGGKIRGRPG